MTHCIVNGRRVAAENALISIQDRGFRYGDGTFETIAVHGGVPYQFDWHMARLASGLDAIRIDFDVTLLRGSCRELLKQNSIGEGILRIQVTRGTGGRGYLPADSQPGFIVETSPLPAAPQEPVSLWQSNYIRISPRALPTRYKLCQGLNSTLARMEAADHGCFDALLFNEQGQFCETSSANLFWLKDDTLYTPSLACGALEGSTRAAILRLYPKLIRETEATLETLGKADAVFITNAALGIVAVGRLQPSGLSWDSAAIATEIRRLIAEDKKDYTEKHRDFW